ncbi:MAG: cation:proton antiporter, partial [Pseudobdellovibrionaceae bacterium]
GLALAQDLAIIPLILLAPALTEMISPDSLWIRWGEGVVFDFVTRGVILIGSIWLLARFAIPFLLDKVMRTRSRELFFYMALFLCIGIAFVVNTAGLTLSIGAFIAGVLVSESPYGRQALSEILPLRDNFLGLFFLSVGMLLDLNFVALHLPVIFASLIGLILIKGAIIYLVMRARNYAHTVGLTTSLLTFNMGEFSFVLLGLGETHHLVSENTHQILLAVTILSLVLTPFLYKLSPRLVSKTDFDKIIREPLGKIKAAQAPSEINNHAIVIGYGVAGQNVGKVLKQLGIPCKALDVNYETVKKLSAQGHDIVFGDASKPDVLISLGLESAKLVVLCVTGETMIEGALLAIRKIRPDIKVIVRSQYLLEAKKLSLTEQD